jgi:DNA (cytosine-5)-methyltransferase 1
VNYYNEHDPKAAAWLRELIKQGHIPTGIVDTRSITEVKPHELTDYTQCHFFAGIGGWSYALQLAGWPTDRAVWTGSCPCQPFSSAGNQLGAADARHLWPVFVHLIAQCRPPIVFGEQVASAIGKGWLDGVCTDLEAEGYACGAAVLGAHSVGAPHIRQRLYWVANTESERSSPGSIRPALTESWQGGGLGHANDEGPQRRIERGDRGNQRTPWATSVVLPCTDGKTRRIESGTFPLAHGVPGRVGLLRGYGNAIVPQVAAAFIEAAINPL